MESNKKVALDKNITLKCVFAEQTIVFVKLYTNDGQINKRFIISLSHDDFLLS
jgi:hypothetical protein